VRAPLLAAILSVVAVPVSAAPILPSAGQYTFSGSFTFVSQYLSVLLPGLETGDEFTGSLEITPVNVTNHQIDVTIAAKGFTFSMMAFGIVPETFGRNMRTTGLTPGVGYLQDFTFWYPTGSSPGAFNLMFTAFPEPPVFSSGIPSFDFAVNGQFGQLTRVSEPATAFMLALGLVVVARLRRPRSQ
jgi:hypothetical protein